MNDYEQNIIRIRQELGDEPMFTLTKVAKWLHISPDKLRKTITVKRVGGRYYISATTVARFLGGTQ